jgi:uncharacterized protein YndB with AHSA1/START domain
MAADVRDAGASERTADREMIVTRVLDAPRELVFDAWTKPHHVARWWGPNGFTTTIHEMDVRPGGEWRLVMHGPDGTDYRNHFVFIDVVRPERIVFKHEPEAGTEAVSFQSTVTFAEREGRTEVTIHHVFPSAAALENAVAKHGAREGAKQTLERLDAYLPDMTQFTLDSVRPIVTLARTFDAPRELVFKALTDPSMVAQWWGPRILAITVEKMEPRPGGIWRIIHRAPDGTEYAVNGVYREIEAPARIVRTVRRARPHRGGDGRARGAQRTNAPDDHVGVCNHGGSRCDSGNRHGAGLAGSVRTPGGTLVILSVGAQRRSRRTAKPLNVPWPFDYAPSALRSG